MTVALPALAQFTGSMGLYFHPLFKGIEYTDGVRYVLHNNAAWLVEDVLAQLKHNPKLSKLEFVVIEFDPVTKTVTYKDDDKLVVAQEYAITDLVVPVKFYLFNEEQYNMGKKLILASEY